MIPSPKFTISTRNYAFLKGSLKEKKQPDHPNQMYPSSFYTMDVFYYKKKGGKIMACFGTVWNYAPQGLSEEEFITQYRSSYGPDPYAQWDGTNFIGTSVYKDIVEYVAELKPILQEYPLIPNGYTGWYKNP